MQVPAPTNARTSGGNVNQLVSGIKFAAALSAIVFVSSISSPAAQAKSPDKVTEGSRLPQFLNWFGGEWNNHEQVWLQKGDTANLVDAKPVDPIAHTHHIFAPVEAPKIGEHMFYIQQNMDADPAKIYRQRLYRISVDDVENAIKLEIFSYLDEKAFVNAHLKPEMFKDLELTGLKANPGCDVYWRYQEAEKEFIGTMKPGACNFFSQRSQKKIIISDTLKLSESEIWINDQARDEQGGYVFGSKTNTPVKNRKVRYYTGWAVLNRAGKDAKPEDKKYSNRRDLITHNEGAYLPVLWDDGTPSPYAVQLAQLTYQNTKTAILKLALVDAVTKKSVMYIWGNTDATRLGMNLTWFQVGLTQKPNRVQYGFDETPKVVAEVKLAASK